MNAKEYLLQVKKIDLLLHNKMVEKKQWEDIAISSTSKLGGDKVQASGSQSKMADAIINTIDIQREIENTIKQLYQTKTEIISVIEQLPAIEYDLLHLHYIQYLPLDEIAIQKDRSYTWATSTHGRALVLVQEILDKKEAYFAEFIEREKARIIGVDYDN